MEYRLDEIFNSIEGEFPKAGVYSTFIRFWKCNYACSWCDTIYREGYGAKPFTYNEIKALLEKSHALTFTGGEPSLFIPDMVSMLDNFIEDEIYMDYIKIETNGSKLGELMRTFRDKYSHVFGTKFDQVMIYSWSPKFYNKNVTKISFKTLYNDFNINNTYIKLVMDPSIESVLRKFIETLKTQYGVSGLKKLALMPLSITKDGKVTGESDKKSILLTKQFVEEYKCNVTLRFHEILEMR